MTLYWYMGSQSYSVGDHTGQWPILDGKADVIKHIEKRHGVEIDKIMVTNERLKQ